jgi:steroid delta-isomerase-like uncharacterized protein
VEKIVEKYIQHYNAMEIDKMIDLFTEDCIFENVSNSIKPTCTHGKEELKNIAAQSCQIFKERKQTVTNWIVGKGKIAIEIDYTATLAVDMPNGLKAGNQLQLKGVSIFEFVNNKIKRLVDFS